MYMIISGTNTDGDNLAPIAQTINSITSNNEIYMGLMYNTDLDDFVLNFSFTIDVVNDTLL